MSKISTADIKKLREETGARVLDCKKALEEADGDFAKAKEIVAEKGLARAEKKQDRETSAGLIACYSHNTGKVGAMVEVQCETDFVAQNEEFQTMARDIAMQITAMNPENVEELLNQEFVKDPSMTVEKLVKLLSGKIGEKMVVKRFERFELGEK
jgi:elongation factor Ts